MKRLFKIILFLITGISVNAQPLDKPDPNYYEAPMKIPFLLSGNFAELRTNHFHGGIDIKTQGHEGLKIYAVQDGYISRIKISPPFPMAPAWRINWQASGINIKYLIISG